MKKNIDKLLPLLLEIERLTDEDREALFIALSEQYQWTPACPDPTRRGVSVNDFGAFAGFTIQDYDVILLSGGADPLQLLRVIRSNTDLSPAAAKALLSSLPAVAKGGLGRDEAIKLQEDFLACGAQAEFCESSRTPERLNEWKGKGL